MGAGYATVAVPADLEPIFEVKLTEVMSRGFAGADGSPGRQLGRRHPRRGRTRGRRWSWARGWGATRTRSSWPAALAQRIEAPLLIDADGLNAHAERLELIAGRAAPTVLTPHAGELGRLLGRDSARGGRSTGSPARARRRSASGAIVVLKGDDTHRRRRRAARDQRGAAAPALATAGHR